MRLWVEILLCWDETKGNQCQPPCEAVSWNFLNTDFWLSSFRQPPCEAVSWNVLVYWLPSCQTVSLFVRLWVEIRLLTDQTFLALRQPPCEAVSWNTYEILYGGSPVCQPPCEAVSWNTRQLWNYCNRCIVSLLVRLWVEIIRVDAMKTETKPSASLWGCELKYSGIYQTAIHECQPPCEAVSWNSWIKS